MLARIRNSFHCGMPKCPTIRIPGMEKPESSAEGESAVELEDRDPNSLNQHLQVMELPVWGVISILQKLISVISWLRERNEYLCSNSVTPLSSFPLKEWVKE